MGERRVRKQQGPLLELATQWVSSHGLGVAVLFIIF